MLQHIPQQNSAMIDVISCRRRCARGQGIVEMSLLAPALVLILIGMIDFARILMVQHAITHAAREGALYASWSDASESEVHLRVRSYLETAGLRASQARVTVSGARARTSEPAVVTIQYSVDSFTLKMMGGERPIRLNSTSSMLRE
ncbi:MAG: TadE/TadG family type IV pilus assembly protein [Acidobacteriota bacterium]|nr:pilus assembly protein [Blastocatellia bacterium]MDW8241361.1 TadE/TadG family type IV pilus assembly protein [Acidobacteriota bacterium]